MHRTPWHLQPSTGHWRATAAGCVRLRGPVLLCSTQERYGDPQGSRGPTPLDPQRYTGERPGRQSRAHHRRCLQAPLAQEGALLEHPTGPAAPDRAAHPDALPLGQLRLPQPQAGQQPPDVRPPGQAQRVGLDDLLLGRLRGRRGPLHGGRHALQCQGDLARALRRPHHDALGHPAYFGDPLLLRGVSRPGPLHAPQGKERCHQRGPSCAACGRTRRRPR